jgi:hypothetical protein
LDLQQLEKESHRDLLIKSNNIFLSLALATLLAFDSGKTLLLATVPANALLLTTGQPDGAPRRLVDSSTQDRRQQDPLSNGSIIGGRHVATKRSKTRLLAMIHHRRSG